ncbi:MAG: pyridoxamine 5'-phosphate oxidase family protein [Candidatus Omnitrophica bacterium]|nr:pyridoxamine 5'-phosphate oxidase family protein [Candidatus Omnitrophota bacterium]MDD5690822.1 pyridoxamine 5'-phosphate oxidase family protein [Candidatus Omnitrophota bacterium]
MKQIPAAVIDFLRTQGFVIVSSIDKNGFPHASCKDIVKIDSSGKIYLVDAYSGETAENIKHNPQINISAVDEHKFMGYCFKGRAVLISGGEISQEFIKSWEANITSRLAKRLLHNLAQNKARAHHPEASLPSPKHLIIVTVEKIVDLTPYYLRKE